MDAIALGHPTRRQSFANTVQPHWTQDLTPCHTWMVSVLTAVWLMTILNTRLCRWQRCSLTVWKCRKVHAWCLGNFQQTRDGYLLVSILKELMIVGFANQSHSPLGGRMVHQPGFNQRTKRITESIRLMCLASQMHRHFRSPITVLGHCP